MIIGNDLVWRNGAWTSDKQASKDSQVKSAKNLTELLANTYRVLLTRGMLGTFVYFTDPETREYFKDLLSTKSTRA